MPVLTYRPGERSDLARCRELLWQGDPLERLGIDPVPLWERCLPHGAFAVIEGGDSRGVRTTQGFGLSVFVQRDFLEPYFTHPTPGVTTAFYRSVLDGRSVGLSESGIAAGNAGDGLDVLVLHFGAAHTDPADPRTHAILAQIYPSFFGVHAGYRIRSILVEAYGPLPVNFVSESPFRLICDFGAASPADFANVLPQERPALLGLRSDWWHGAQMYPLSQLFAPPAPRASFPRAERQLLLRALANASDGDIAAALGLSPHTVKRVWRNALDRAVRTLPGVMPEVDGDRLVRGPERRRHLLDYLRLHMEELRPYPKPGRDR